MKRQFIGIDRRRRGPGEAQPDPATASFQAFEKFSTGSKSGKIGV
jgi:hypothetical protein